MVRLTGVPRAARPAAADVLQRLQLRKLVKPAVQALQDGAITAGHAVELARLRPGDQSRMLDHAREESVASLQGWIARSVAIPAPDGVVPVADNWDVILPAETLRSEAYVALGDELSGIERGGPLSSAEECEHAVDALVVVGLRRGTRLRICPRRSRCEKHWQEHVEGLKRKREQERQWKLEDAARVRERDKNERERKRWSKEMTALRQHLLSGTWDADAMIRVVLDALRSDCHQQTPPGLDPLHEAAYLAVTAKSWDRDGVVARARVLGVRLDRQGHLVEPKRGDHGLAPEAVQPSARAAAACDGPSPDGSGGGI